MRNTLHFGDNLNIMRNIPSESYHLCYLDPPFNSGRNYNIFLADSKAQRKAFNDIWLWDDAARKNRDAIENYNGRHPELIDVMDNVSFCLKGFDNILREGRWAESMRAYLAFMAPRLVDIWRLLKSTGSVYLHCDPHASHYLKCVMDVIFGAGNFKNEIIWHYRRWTAASKQFQKMHDVILYYTKTNEYLFTKPLQPYANEEYIENTVRGVVDGKLVRLKDDKGNYIKRKTQRKGVLMHDVWHDINFIAPGSKERLGYPTQKPIKLLERIITASSNPGEVVFDPFCGCGTALDAAQGLNRHWVGIDLTVLALEPMERRLQERHGLKLQTDYHIEGYPTTYEDTCLLAERNPNDFANWAVTRLGLSPTPNSNDGGFDGTGKMLLWENKHVAETEQKKLPIIAEVKSGRTLNPNQVRAFRTAMQDEDAAIGVFITLHPVTRGMRNLADGEGFIEHKGKRYPRLQFWQITDNYFTQGTIPITLPWKIDERPKALQHHERQQTFF